MVLFVGNDNVDIIFVVEIVVYDRKKIVIVGREVDVDDFGGFVGDDVEEIGVLMSEIVMVLMLDCGGK